MTVFNTCYETTLGSAIRTKALETSIQSAIVSDGIDQNTLGVLPEEELAPLFVVGSSSSESNIPLFAHPLLLSHNGKKFLCSDIRLSVKFTPNSTVPVPRNQTEYNFVKSRTVLNLAWLAGSPLAMKNTLSFAGQVYAGWISEVVAKRFALDPRDQLVLTIIAHCFFQCLHYPDDFDFDNEENKQLFTVHTMKAARVNSQMVFEVIDKLKYMRNVSDFCDNVRKVIENVRLQDFAVGTLITCISTSWFGTNAAEILAVALEHPPTWYAIVYASLEERTYKNSMIARVAERYGKGGAWVDFKQAYVHLVKEHTEDTRAGLESADVRPTFKPFQD